MASDDAKPPASPPAVADPPADDATDNADPEETKVDADAEPDEEGDNKQQEQEKEDQEEQGEKTPQQPEKRRGRRKKGEADAGAKTPPSKKKLPTPGIERPSRERKTVERYSELAPRVTPVKKSPAILQGSGTKLKDIPNVSFKLSKRKADENLQSLHTLIYGKKSNVHFLKRNISQFSGFVWTDNEEKHRNRIKEKLDKFNKEKLLDFCEILDIHVSKATTKKEEVSAKLLEFLESPYITRDVVLTDDKKKRRRRSKGNGQATSEGASLGKKRRRTQKEGAEIEKENDDEDDAGSGSEDASMDEGDGGSEANDAVCGEESDAPPAKKKSTDVKQENKEAVSKAKEKDTPKTPSTKPGKGASKSSEDLKAEPDVASKRVGRRAKSLKENDVPVDSNKANKRVSKSKKDEAQNSKVGTKDGAKLSNKTKGKGKGGADAGSAPTTEQLHAVVTTILKEVDFNTATLADILRQLGTHFNMDLMDRKAEVKHIIEEVINSMSDDDDGDDGNSEDEAKGNGKAKNQKDEPKEGEEK